MHELLLSGEANTAWLEGLRDEWIQDAQAEFAEEFDVAAELPEALASRIGERTEERPLFEEFPGGAHPRHEEHVETMQKLLRRGGFKGVLGYLDSLREGSASPGFKDHLSVQCLWRLGRLEEALARCEEVCVAYPDYESGVTDRALLLRNLERGDESHGVLREFLETHPTAGRVWALDASLHVTEGAFDAARQAMRDAFASGVPAAELEHVAFMMTRAEDGPAWGEFHEYTSRNYVVRSDLDERTCIETAKTLESALAMYKRLFGQPDSSGDDHGRYEVYLFSGSAGYHAYTRDLLGSAATGSAGLYSPVLKQLIIWNLPDRDMMLRTIRHEGFHQYLDRLLEVQPPTWFNEGTAEYMETAHLERGRMTPGEPVMGHVISLNAEGVDWIPLDELMAALPSGFYGDAGDTYGQSWALVHYLLEGAGREEREMYQTYLDALLEGRSREAAAEEAFAGTDMRSLGRAVKRHLRDLGEDL